MQRIGRINRVGTEYNNIYVYNFFPAAQSNAHLPLEENIISKIQAFHDTLGEDFKYLSEDEEVSSHNLYRRLNSKEALESDYNDEVSELKYLNIIRQVRDENEELYQKIKNLPRKAKSGRNNKKLLSDKTLTFVRKGGLKKFFIADEKDSNEIFFLQAMKYLEVDENAKKVKIPKKYFQHLELNKLGFEICLTEEKDVIIDKSSRSNSWISYSYIF